MNLKVRYFFRRNKSYYKE